MGKSRSKKKPKKAKKRKAKKPTRVKGPLWKIWLFKFLKEKMPGEKVRAKVRARITKRGSVAKRLTRRLRR